MRTDLVVNVNAVPYRLDVNMTALTLVYVCQNTKPKVGKAYEIHYPLTREEDIIAMFAESNVDIDLWNGSAIPSLLVSDDHLVYLPDGKIVIR